MNDLKDKCMHWELLIMEQIDEFKMQFSTPDAALEVLGFNSQGLTFSESTGTKSQIKAISYAAFGEWAKKAIHQRMMNKLIEQQKNIVEIQYDQPGFSELLEESSDLPIIDEDYGQFTSVTRLTYASDTHIYDHLFFNKKDLRAMPCSAGEPEQSKFNRPDCIRKQPKPQTKSGN